MKRISWIALPGILGLAMLGVLALWLGAGPREDVAVREPGADNSGQAAAVSRSNPVLAGKLTLGTGKPGASDGAWPQFRGPNRTGVAQETRVLAEASTNIVAERVWSIHVGEGYAGPVVRDGRVYLMDYDQEKKEDALRCLSLENGEEIWRFSYPIAIKRNHGMSRTVPALAGEFVVAMGPKCQVLCLGAESGELKWSLDLGKDFGATVPPWYTGQCPLIEGDRVILAPGGKEALLMAVDLRSGDVLWKTPNPKGWKMTHSSVMPMEWGGRRFYVYSASEGVVGVAAEDGALLWETGDWKISIAAVPSPVVLDQGRIFFSGGYNAGSVLLQVRAGEPLQTERLLRLEASVFGATQHTPIYYGGYLYGIRADGRLVCLDLSGRVRWVSEGEDGFGLGPFLIANGLILGLTESGELRVCAATPRGYEERGRAQVVDGHECWGPMSLAGERLLARGLTELVCVRLER